MELLILLLLGILAYFIIIYLIPKKPLPPGPFQWPILGNILDVYRADPTYPHLAFQKLSEKYGDIFMLKLGVVNTLVLSKYEDMEELLSREDCAGRYEYAFVTDRSFGVPYGIIFPNGQRWSDQRRYCVRTLREFGFGKSHSMETTVEEELEELIMRMKKEMVVKNGIVEFEGYFNHSVVSLTWSYVFGYKPAPDDEKVKRMLQISRIFTRNMTFDDIKLAYPALRHIFPKLTGFDKQMEVFIEQQNFIRESILPFKMLLGNETKSFVEAYLKEIQNNVGENLDSIFTEEQLIITVVDMFVAAFETTGAFLGYCILTMLLNPTVQRKVQKEIDQVVGRNVVSFMTDIQRMPYLQAAMLEVQRFSSFVAFVPARKTLTDVSYKGYIIPKNTAIVANLHANFHDKRYWRDPEVFRPERFLDDNGVLIKPNVERISAVFGFGPRKCIGNELARTTTSMYFATLLQQFSFETIPKETLPTMEPIANFVLSPKLFRALITVR